MQQKLFKCCTSIILIFLRYQRRLTVDLGGGRHAFGGMFLSSNSTSFMWRRNRCYRCLGGSVFSALIARMDSVDPNNGGLCGLFEYLFLGNNGTIFGRLTGKLFLSTMKKSLRMSAISKLCQFLFKGILLRRQKINKISHNVFGYS